ncbi:MAG: nucleotidyltransferase [Bacteroidetes bacterium]|nr:nucleotidyltransferase [Bacteroidota bacterium]
MSVQKHLTDTASNLVLSTTEKENITTSITTLNKRLTAYFQTDIKQQFRFGSSTRGTILPRKADTRSDIDYMILFANNTALKPQTFIDRLKRFAQNKYTTSEIAQSHPTVVLSLNHIKFDLVPGYINLWGSIQIPAPSSSYQGWMSTDPNGFNQTLTDKNQSNGYLIKPTIRLVKYWNALNGYVYDSYALEQHIVGGAYWFCSNQKEYFYKAIENLPTNWGLPQYKIDKVVRAQNIIRNVKSFEAQSMPANAELHLKSLIPTI